MGRQKWLALQLLDAHKFFSWNIWSLDDASLLFDIRTSHLRGILVAQ